jgi:hypothetical protein
MIYTLNPNKFKITNTFAGVLEALFGSGAVTTMIGLSVIKHPTVALNEVLNLNPNKLYK